MTEHIHRLKNTRTGVMNCPYVLDEVENERKLWFIIIDMYKYLLRPGSISNIDPKTKQTRPKHHVFALIRLSQHTTENQTTE